MPLDDAQMISFTGLLNKPVVHEFNLPNGQTIQTLNQAIPFDEFRFSYKPEGTALSFTGESPRFTYHSVGNQDEETNKEDLDFLTTLYGDAVVMAQYMTGATKDAAYAKTRFETFQTRWNGGSTFSGVVAVNKEDGERSAIYNIGGSGKPTIAEFAAVSSYGKDAVRKEEWKKGNATEAGLLFFYKVLPTMQQDAKLKLMLDGSILEKVEATARFDNPSYNVLSNLGLDKAEVEEKYGAQRQFFRKSVADLAKIGGNTELVARLRA
jgi:hypothetical protein